MFRTELDGVGATPDEMLDAKKSWQTKTVNQKHVEANICYRNHKARTFLPKELGTILNIVFGVAHDKNRLQVLYNFLGLEPTMLQVVL